MNNIQKVQTDIKHSRNEGICPAIRHSWYGFDLNYSVHTVYYKLIDGVKDRCFVQELELLKDSVQHSTKFTSYYQNYSLE